MAVYRHIHINYWQDGFVLDLTPEEKYFYIYLMTNSKTSQCGIYELPKRIMETETGYNRETVEKLVKRFEEYGKVIYCEETKELFLKNWMKHNRCNSPKVKKCILGELEKIKHKEFVKEFFYACKEYGYSIDSLSKDYGEKEKEKEKQKQKEEEKEKLKIKNYDCDKKVSLENKKDDEEFIKCISKFKILYEQNVGLINGIVSEWLFEICETIDYELFKKAIEIATDRGKCNKGYINGILNQWSDNNIKSIEDLKAHEVGIKNRGDKYGKYSNNYRKNEYATWCENEDEGLYRKPTPEEIAAVEREFGEFRNRH